MWRRKDAKTQRRKVRRQGGKVAKRQGGTEGTQRRNDAKTQRGSELPSSLCPDQHHPARSSSPSIFHRYFRRAAIHLDGLHLGHLDFPVEVGWSLGAFGAGRSTPAHPDPVDVN